MFRQTLPNDEYVIGVCFHGDLMLDVDASLLFSVLDVHLDIRGLEHVYLFDIASCILDFVL